MKLLVTTSMVLMSLTASVGRAGEFTYISHEASGEWWANVFDGGPVVYGSGATSGPSDWLMLSGALDLTRPGVSGGSFNASGRSRIEVVDSLLAVTVENKVNYTASLSIDGDRPGGTGGGGLTSVVEFGMPVEELEWQYSYRVLAAPGFTSHAMTHIENVTQGRSLITFTETTPLTVTTLSGEIGDVIRITSVMAGSGYAPPDDFASYRANGILRTYFIIPEPCTLCLLAGGLFLIPRRRCRAVVASVAALILAAAPAGAGEFTYISHEASGEAWANVFDGGPVVYGSGMTSAATHRTVRVAGGARQRAPLRVAAKRSGWNPKN